MVREFLNILFRKSDLIYGDIQDAKKSLQAFKDDYLSGHFS